MQNQIHGPFGSFKLRPKTQSGRQLTGQPDPDQQSRESIRHQLSELEAEQAALKSRFGCASFADVTRMIESLEAQLKDFYGRQAANLDSGSLSNSTTSAGIQLEAFLSEIGCESLDQTLSMIHSLQDQLHQLYAEGETRAAEQNLCSMYEEKQTFHNRFGFSGVEETAAMISSMESQLRDFYARQAHAA
jgi:hypothetical protein